MEDKYKIKEDEKYKEQEDKRYQVEPGKAKIEYIKPEIKLEDIKNYIKPEIKKAYERSI